MANVANYGDKYTHRVTLRLTDGQFDFLTKMANVLDVSPSDYLRMSINAGMISLDKVKDLGKDGGTSYENVKADINNLV